jgi:rubrerythrin
MNLDHRLTTLISKVVAEPRLHARWLNTFSFLEYVGFRKIVKSQKAEALSAEILAHALEEGRHALSLKKLAMKIGGKTFDSYEPEAMLCGEAAEDYFQTLDHACDEALSDQSEELRSALVYLYVTWLVEIRALDVYTQYRKALAAMPGVQALDGLLAEEEQHLSRVAGELQKRDPDFPARSKIFAALETALYEKILGAFETEVSSPSLLARTA